MVTHDLALITKTLIQSLVSEAEFDAPHKQFSFSKTKTESTVIIEEAAIHEGSINI